MTERFRFIELFLKFLKAYRVLAASLLFCCALSLFRVLWTGHITYIFLVWNLFLGAIPWGIALVMRYRQRIHQGLSLRAFAMLTPLWLLFLPNAPYIITDLFHLRYIQGPAIWFDVVLILSYAWTGLLFGLSSLSLMERVLGQWLPRLSVNILSVFVLFLSAFGIYLGRVLRWNSWDIVHHPMYLLSDVGELFLNPMSNLSAWGMTITLGLFLNLIYWSLRTRTDEVSFID